MNIAAASRSAGRVSPLDTPTTLGHVRSFGDLRRTSPTLPRVRMYKSTLRQCLFFRKPQPFFFPTHKITPLSSLRSLLLPPTTSHPQVK
ncbi:hypothetical protein B0T16DRAFT_10494 [Cercophora newfieldiana]|uniref:Uncharacterized protein n=1 Tax=Cercophora newfieldiana TaxID=92897 RepID=A0AA39YMR0_9PEZI|nr:hypothetical protein B0T16DRAFT_10494 [Cercophora newfieldiana]